MIYSWDERSKCAFSYDDDFRYEGRLDEPPPGAVLVGKERRELGSVGCWFLTGGGERTICNIDGKSPPIKSLSRDRSSPFSIFGNRIADPEWLASVCEACGAREVRACGLMDELAAFGVLLCAVEPGIARWVDFHVPNVFESKDRKLDIAFDAKLGVFGDGLGKMAFHVSNGGLVLNEMMTTPGLSPFYSKVIGSKYVAGGVPCYAMLHAARTKFFPAMPFSMAFSVATVAPVRIRNTDIFASAAGCQSEWVDLLLSSEFIPGLSTFLRQYEIMSGRPFVALMDPHSLGKDLLEKTLIASYNGLRNCFHEK